MVALAHVSGFRADHVKSLNWDIVFFLTPWGLFHNLVMGANEYLHRAYWMLPPPQTFSWEQPAWNWHYLYIYMQSNLLEVLPLLFVWPRWKPRLLTAARISLLNGITHPIVFFVLMHLPLGYLWNILLAEGFAVVAESLVYRRLGYSRPFAASLFANLISWQVAPLFTALIFLRDKL